MVKFGGEYPFNSFLHLDNHLISYQLTTATSASLGYSFFPINFILLSFVIIKFVAVSTDHEKQKLKNSRVIQITFCRASDSFSLTLDCSLISRCD